MKGLLLDWILCSLGRESPFDADAAAFVVCSFGGYVAPVDEGIGSPGLGPLVIVLVMACVV